MENQVDAQTESSPVTLEVPHDGAAYATWRQTGKLPEVKPAQPKGESAPPKESSAEGQEPKGKAAPASEAGNKDQEKQKPPRDNAASRLNELLEDLRRAGLTPAESGASPARSDLGRGSAFRLGSPKFPPKSR